MTISAQQRRAIRLRASECFEYCRIGEGEQSARFHVDHIIAISHGGEDIDQNLCLACMECNSYKGANIAAYDPLNNKLSRLYHPRLEEWDDHFLIDHDASIKGRTPEGRTTVYVLRINDVSRVRQRFREYLLGNYPCQKNA